MLEWRRLLLKDVFHPHTKRWEHTGKRAPASSVKTLVEKGKPRNRLTLWRPAPPTAIFIPYYNAHFPGFQTYYSKVMHFALETAMSVLISYSPLSGEPIGFHAMHSPEEVATVIASAKRAFPLWSSLTPALRCKHLELFRCALAEKCEEIARTVHLEIGKPLQEVYGAEILPTLRATQWLERSAPPALRLKRVSKAYLFPMPYGLVAVIGTWNYPIWLNAAPILWALIAGNVVVWKPSELALNSAKALQSCFETAGLPVFLLVGDGKIGQHLCKSPIQKLAFTGSASTGRAILQALATDGIPALMELSGNDAAIVAADANISLAARSLVWSRCCNAGQSCLAPQRIYVHKDRYEDFLFHCKEQMEGLRPEKELSPLRTEAHRKQVHQLVQKAVSSGAKLLTGGYPLPRKGVFYAPTLLADCNDAMEVMCEDFFGPVLPIAVIESVEEGIERANRDEFALGASLWTSYMRQAKVYANQLRAGVVAINQETLLLAADPAIPFGGCQASGFGKQRGLAGLEEFVVWKAVSATSYRGARKHLYPYNEASLPILRGLVALHASHGLSWLRALGALRKPIIAWVHEERTKLTGGKRCE